MQKHENFFIEMLDNGFVIKDGKTKNAVETSQKVEERLVTKFKDAISGINKTGINNMVISFSVDENVPEVSTR